MPRINAYSADWITVRDHCRALIDRARATIEEPGLDPAKTEFHRGTIRALRAVLSLEEDEIPTRD